MIDTYLVVTVVANVITIILNIGVICNCNRIIKNSKRQDRP